MIVVKIAILGLYAVSLAAKLIIEWRASERAAAEALMTPRERRLGC
jgi:hypothetical protein